MPLSPSPFACRCQLRPLHGIPASTSPAGLVTRESVATPGSTNPALRAMSVPAHPAWERVTRVSTNRALRAMSELVRRAQAHATPGSISRGLSAIQVRPTEAAQSIGQDAADRWLAPGERHSFHVLTGRPKHSWIHLVASRYLKKPEVARIFCSCADQTSA